MRWQINKARKHRGKARRRYRKGKIAEKRDRKPVNKYMEKARARKA